jgi:nucleoside-diphosphate-sugar epimerase
VITDSFKPSVFLEDLENITRTSAEDLSILVNKNILLTGSTGFVGTWLSSSYLHALETLGGSGTLTCVARSFDSLDIHRSIIHSHPSVRLIPSDVRSIDIPRGSEIDMVIHAATPASASINTNHPLEMVSIIVDGQRRILDQAVKIGAQRVVFMSSGAVYGSQPMDLDGLPLDWEGGPQITNPANAYHEAKRLAELLGHVYARESSVEFVTARLFAFLAPFLPLDQHFAAGNFLFDGLRGRYPQVRGSGLTRRSYQYGSDMTSSIWALMTRATNLETFNIGGQESVTIDDLAFRVGLAAGVLIPENQKIGHQQGIPSNYSPDVSATIERFAVRNEYSLDMSIERTLTWLREDNQ